MNEAQYFYAFRFVSGLLGFVLLTNFFRYLGHLTDTKKSSNELDLGPSTVNDWNGLEELIVVDQFMESPDIKTLRLKRKSGANIPQYDPGQFLSFEISKEKKVFRSYSVSGIADNHSIIQVSVKLIENGLGSTKLHSLKEGDSIWAYPPSGLFTDQHLKEESERVFIAGGVGITPLLSMIETALARGEKHKMTLFYAARNREDFAFHERLDYLSLRFPNLNYLPYLSGKSSEDWKGGAGRLNFEIIKNNLSNLKSSHYFFCGPEKLTEVISIGLLKSGVPSENIHSEEFISPTNLEGSEIEERKVDITFNGSKLSYQGKDNILDFLEKNNFDIPFACRSGVCGECKLKRGNGKIKCLSDSGLQSSEKEEYFLSCVSYPEEDISIDSAK